MRREHGDLRETRPRGRVSGIEADGLLEGGEGLAEVLLPPKVPALQVAAVGLEVADLRAGLNGSRSRSEASLHRVDDSRRDLVLDGEDVRGVAIESLRPEVEAARDIGQLGGDPQPAARRPNAALEDVVDGEGPRDRGQVGALLPRPKRRGPGCHADPVDPHERVHDLLGHALAEVILVFRGTQVRERQHRDGHGGNGLRGGIGARRGRHLQPRFSQAVQEGLHVHRLPPLLEIRPDVGGEIRP